MILSTSTNHAKLKGGFASSFGKQVEKPLIKTICKILEFQKTIMKKTTNKTMVATVEKQIST